MAVSALPTVIYTPLRDPRPYAASFDGARCVVESAHGALVARLQAQGSEAAYLKLDGSFCEGVDASVPVALDYLFSHFPFLKNMTVTCLDRPDGLTLERQDSYQLPDAWLAARGQRHGTLYRRYVPAIGGTLSFRVIDAARDLDTFHHWHNQPRVADLWELNQSKGDLHQYMERGLKDSHQIPLILEFNGQPVGYFEVYWAIDDRIAPYYECEQYDRGFHFLIGERSFLGRHKTDAAIGAVMHLIYLDEPRTQRIVAEPRADNKLVMKCAERVAGWRFIKEFDFPHKRAALLMANRSDFFQGNAP